MQRTRVIAQVVGVVAVAGGMTFVAAALTGGPEWLAQCGGRFTRHECGPGETPWGVFFQGLVLITVGLAVAGGEMAFRHGRLQFTAGRDRRPDRTGSSFPPPGA